MFDDDEHAVMSKRLIRGRNVGETMKTPKIIKSMFCLIRRIIIVVTHWVFDAKVNRCVKYTNREVKQYIVIVRRLELSNKTRLYYSTKT